MKTDLILAGVGGQGILSVAAILCAAAVKQGLNTRQSEVHGMAQRGGAVLAHLRIADTDIESDLIPLKKASCIVSMEPLESLRYIHYLQPDGIVITAIDPVKNIEDYPSEESLMHKLHSLPAIILVPAKQLALKAGSPKVTNMVLVGAASRVLPLDRDILEKSIIERFRPKGETVVSLNIQAFHFGAQIEHRL
ncbi:MAG: indolepyruvate oxidoreductase subunit beta [Chitinivibrionales bacterium]|nr:indolepyruvate oxidoreductase subunit beta [Chitinivibrionales bacterium]